MLSAVQACETVPEGVHSLSLLCLLHTLLHDHSHQCCARNIDLDHQILVSLSDQYAYLCSQGIAVSLQVVASQT